MMRNKVEVRYHKAVTEIITPPVEANAQFIIKFTDTTEYAADKVLITTGGFPKAEQYAWIEALGHTIQKPVPSLFTFNMPGNPITELMGVSAPATVKINGTKIATHGPLLITHWGMSGPAILKASAFGARELAARNYEFSISVNWLLDVNDAGLREAINDLRKEQGKQLVQNKNPFCVPKRLWEHMLTKIGITDETRWGELAASAQNKLIETLLRDTYNVKGKTTFKEEFVTCGGINLDEVDPQTLESRKVKGLYFAGEILDADGITGGYNFQHAWSSSWSVAQQFASLPA
jgi:predicted Rossmann fold flavoprotein